MGSSHVHQRAASWPPPGRIPWPPSRLAIVATAHVLPPDGDPFFSRRSGAVRGGGDGQQSRRAIATGSGRVAGCRGHARLRLLRRAGDPRYVWSQTYSAEEYVALLPPTPGTSPPPRSSANACSQGFATSSRPDRTPACEALPQHFCRWVAAPVDAHRVAATSDVAPPSAHRHERAVASGHAAALQWRPYAASACPQDAPSQPPLKPGSIATQRERIAACKFLSLRRSCCRLPAAGNALIRRDPAVVSPVDIGLTGGGRDRWFGGWSGRESADRSRGR